jgi:hypothetical protein
VWLTLIAFALGACTTMTNVRPEDYARIDPENDYRIVTIEGTEYEATHLSVTDSVATFTHKGETKSVHTSRITLIQAINNNAMLTTGIGVGIALALAVGLVVVFTQD